MGSRSVRPLLLACTALVAVSAILPAHAQDAAGTAATKPTEEETRLQTIVVKGKRVPAGSVADTPLATTTDAKTLQKKQVDDVDDLGHVLSSPLPAPVRGVCVRSAGLPVNGTP